MTTIGQPAAEADRTVLDFTNAEAASVSTLTDYSLERELGE